MCNTTWLDQTLIAVERHVLTRSARDIYFEFNFLNAVKPSILRPWPKLSNSESDADSPLDDRVEEVDHLSRTAMVGDGGP